jgi:hypothetical protein
MEKGGLMRFTQRLARIVLVMVACMGGDQATKSIAISVLPETATWSLNLD